MESLFPDANAHNGELVRVCACADIHETYVFNGVEHSVGRCPASFANEVVDLDLWAFALGMVVASSVPEVADEFFLLGVDGDKWLMSDLEIGNCLLDEEELLVAIRRRAAFMRLLAGLSRISHDAEQSADGVCAHPMPLVLHGLADLGLALLHPAEGNLRIPTDMRFDDVMDHFGDLRALHKDALATSAF